MSPDVSIDEQRRIPHVQTVWPTIPLRVFHQTDYLHGKHPFYVFKSEDTSSVTFTSVNSESSLFRIYEGRMLGYSNIIGYVFVPRLSVVDIVRRFTPYVVTLTPKGLSYDDVRTSDIHILYSTPYFNLFRLDCGSECIQSLSVIMGVSITSSQEE